MLLLLASLHLRRFEDYLRRIFEAYRQDSVFYKEMSKAMMNLIESEMFVNKKMKAAEPFLLAWCLHTTLVMNSSE
jgi:hypothetical protein